VIRNGDVIMSTVRPNLKAFAYCDLPQGNFVGSTGFAVLRAKNDTDSRFILYSLLSDDITQQINQLVVGSNYPAINSSDIKRLLLPAFSINQQRKIGEILRSIDRTITHTEALIEKYQQIKAGLMHDLFTRGIGADGKVQVNIEEVA
jgi:type I restriction enzyme, S subunit